MDISCNDVRNKVINSLCISLALEPDNIRDDSRLINDLGMDSLDFLDIMFSLEKEFNMKIRDADFDRVLRPERSLAKEFLSEEEIAQLATVIPSLKTMQEKIPRRELFSFITVETLIRMVGRKLAKKG